MGDLYDVCHEFNRATINFYENIISPREFKHFDKEQTEKELQLIMQTDDTAVINILGPILFKNRDYIVEKTTSTKLKIVAVKILLNQPDVASKTKSTDLKIIKEITDTIMAINDDDVDMIVLIFQKMLALFAQYTLLTRKE